MTGIYKIYNINKSTKLYIGQAIDLDKRKREHFNALKKGIHFNKHLQRAVNKNGIGAFTFEIIETCEAIMLCERETFYVSHFNSKKRGYNQTLGGEDNPMNHAKHRQAVSNALKGHKKTKEWIDKLVKNRDQAKSLATKITNGHIKKVYAYKITGEYIGCYIGYMEIAKQFKINESNVRQIIAGKMKTVKGLHFCLNQLSVEEVLKRVDKSITEEYRQKMSNLTKGSNNPMYGKIRNDIKGDNNWMRKNKLKGVPIWFKVNKEEVFKLRAKGLKQIEIAKKVGCSQQHVSFIINQAAEADMYAGK